MSGGDRPTGLYLPGTDLVRRLAPEAKIIAAVVFVFAVVATPRERFVAFACHLLILVVVWVAAAIPPMWLARRALIEVPFVVLAVALPFVTAGPSIEVAGLTLSEPGLLAGWNILVKGTLGVLTSLTLAAVTPWRDLLLGVSRLRVPSVIVTIATLMIRYLDVLVAEAARMRLARVSRGHDPRLLTQAAATARGIGVLFIRGYERGERVHLAMLARGWTGRMPALPRPATVRHSWPVALSPAVFAVGVCLAAIP